MIFLFLFAALLAFLFVVWCLLRMAARPDSTNARHRHPENLTRKRREPIELSITSDITAILSKPDAKVEG